MFVLSPEKFVLSNLPYYILLTHNAFRPKTTINKMSKKRFDVDRALNELSEIVKKPKSTPESLLSELESTVKVKSDISNSPRLISVERKSFRQKDSLGFQIQSPTTYVPKTKYSLYYIFDSDFIC